MSHIMGNFPIEILIIFLIGLLIYYFIKNQNKKKSINREEFFEWIERMSGYEFEKYLEKLFVALDYKVVRTPGSKDMGADLILKSQSKIIAVEAKRWTGSIGNSVIRSIAGGMQYHHADEGWVITNSTFTELAYKQATASGIKLIDGHNLKKIQEDAYQNLTKSETSKKGLEKLWTKQGVAILSIISIITVIISSSTNHS
jgi:restriction system protein